MWVGSLVGTLVEIRAPAVACFRPALAEVRLEKRPGLDGCETGHFKKQARPQRRDELGDA